MRNPMYLSLLTLALAGCSGGDTGGGNLDTSSGGSGTTNGGVGTSKGGATAGKGGVGPSSGGATTGTAGASTGGSQTSAGGAAPSSAGAGGESDVTDLRTLKSCTTSMAAGTPEFFSTYFKCVSVSNSKGSTAITSQNLPPHKSNYWGAADPNYVPFDTARGAQYKANPNIIKEKAYTITVPDSPVAKGITITDTLVDGVVGTSNEEYPMSIAGVALDSVTLFNPLAAAGDDIEVEKYTFDDYNGHPEHAGVYHYHTVAPGPLEVLAAIGAPAAVELYGIMCDGSVVLGCTELDGSAADLTKLDAQGGHLGDIKDDKGKLYFTNRYHTHVCPTKTGGHKYTPEIQYYTSCGK